MGDYSYKQFETLIEKFSDREVTAVVERIALHYRVPEQSAGAFARWFVSGVKPGDFLSNMIAGHVFAALHHADKDNIGSVPEWAKLFHNFLPMRFWGSREFFESWRKEPEPARRGYVRRAIYDWLAPRHKTLEQFCIAWARDGKAIADGVTFCSWCDAATAAEELQQGLCPGCFEEEQSMFAAEDAEAELGNE